MHPGSQRLFDVDSSDACSGRRLLFLLMVDRTLEHEPEDLPAPVNSQAQNSIVSIHGRKAQRGVLKPRCIPDHTAFAHRKRMIHDEC